MTNKNVTNIFRVVLLCAVLIMFVVLPPKLPKDAQVTIRSYTSNWTPVQAGGNSIFSYDIEEIPTSHQVLVVTGKSLPVPSEYFNDGCIGIKSITETQLVISSSCAVDVMVLVSVTYISPR